MNNASAVPGLTNARRGLVRGLTVAALPQTTNFEFEIAGLWCHFIDYFFFPSQNRQLCIVTVESPTRDGRRTCGMQNAVPEKKRKTNRTMINDVVGKKRAPLSDFLGQVFEKRRYFSAFLAIFPLPYRLYPARTRRHCPPIFFFDVGLTFAKRRNLQRNPADSRFC